MCSLFDFQFAPETGKGQCLPSLPLGLVLRYQRRSWMQKSFAHRKGLPHLPVARLTQDSAKTFLTLTLKECPWGSVSSVRAQIRGVCFWRSHLGRTQHFQLCRGGFKLLGTPSLRMALRTGLFRHKGNLFRHGHSLDMLGPDHHF